MFQSLRLVDGTSCWSYLASLSIRVEWHFRRSASSTAGGSTGRCLASCSQPESSHLTLDREDCLLSQSITYRIALGPRTGQKALTLRSLPGTPLPEPEKAFLARADGFSMHAGV